MAVNCVAPIQERRLDSGGKVLGLFEPPQYRVDEEGIPELVARGVMPFRFLRMRKDFGTRFKGCEAPLDVLAVLVGEGHFRCGS